jgi:alpha-D-xyloside xylohydrolase
VPARWDDLYRQIAAGTNLSMSGLPNWTFDIGGFAVEGRYQQPDRSALDEWRELNLRWFQFGAFVPLFRSHGEAPLREIYNLAPSGSEVYESLAAASRLRYRLLPYIYTIAADTYHRDGTMMRGLIMDFPEDVNARNVNDQYLFGPSLLVSPVYRYQARLRHVYLPAGASWYDFHTGERFAGGRGVEARAPLGHLPLFVRAGAILPIGPAVQHTAEKLQAPITLYVYRGADGAFSLYEDDGLTYGYERGEFARIPISYDDSTGTLRIGARSGAFPRSGRAADLPRALDRSGGGARRGPGRAGGCDPPVCGPRTRAAGHLAGSLKGSAAEGGSPRPLARFLLGLTNTHMGI